MRVFYDTEFVEDGKTIDLISIAMVNEYGNSIYMVSHEFDQAKAEAHPFVSKRVLPQIEGRPRFLRSEIRDQLTNFLSPRGVPELWGWFSAWDHIALMQLWGTFDDQPLWLPNRTNDVAQLWDSVGGGIPHQPSGQHDALQDALWTKGVYDALQARR